MNITRNTMRADGLTVGQALDRDAAFLRSIGIPAKDGALTIQEQRDAFIEEFRDAALKAMDLTAASLRQKGPADADLPAIFKALDPIAERIFRLIPLQLPVAHEAALERVRADCAAKFPVITLENAREALAYQDERMKFHGYTFPPPPDL